MRAKVKLPPQPQFVQSRLGVVFIKLSPAVLLGEAIGVHTRDPRQILLYLAGDILQECPSGEETDLRNFLSDELDRHLKTIGKTGGTRGDVKHCFGNLNGVHFYFHAMTP